MNELLEEIIVRIIALVAAAADLSIFLVVILKIH